MTIRKNEVLFFLLFIPFYKLLLFGLMQAHNFHEDMFRIIETAYDVLRVAAAGYGYLLLLVAGCRFITKTGLLFICLFAMQAVSCLMNGSLSFFVLAKVYTYIGFVLICCVMNYYSPDRIFRVSIFLFMVLSFAGILSVYLFPMGFLEAGRVYSAVYFLGGKNSSFPFYYIFVFTWYAYSLRNRKHLPSLWYLPLVLMLIAAVICRSANSFVSLVLMASACCLYAAFRLSFSAKAIVTGLFVMLGLIYLGAELPVLPRVLHALGRNTTFSYRTVLWGQAFRHIINNPVFGSGADLIFTLGSKLTTDHAHSCYLDSLAKYGLAYMAFFALIIWQSAGSITRIRDKSLRTLITLLMSVYLLHMGFDDYNLNFFILLIMIIDNYCVRSREFSL